MKFKLKEILNRKGITIYRFCKDLNYNESMVHKWIYNGSMPKSDKLDVICAYLKIDIDELLEAERR